MSVRLGATSWLARFEEYDPRRLDGTGAHDRALPIALSALEHARQVSDITTVLPAAQLLQTMAPLVSGDGRSLPMLAIQATAAGNTVSGARWCLQGFELSGPDPSSLLTGFAMLAALEMATARGDLDLAAQLHGRLSAFEAKLLAALNPPCVAS